MLTVKWQKKGYEQIIPSISTWFRDDQDGRILFVEKSSNFIEQYDDGDFYVMNENGKTVADYHLVKDNARSLIPTKRRRVLREPISTSKFVDGKQVDGTIFAINEETDVFPVPESNRDTI